MPCSALFHFLYKIIGLQGDTKLTAFKSKNSIYQKKQCIDPLRAALSFIYRMLLVVILCGKSLAIKADVRLCLGNKNVDTPIVGDLGFSGAFPWFSRGPAGDESFLPFTGLILPRHSSHTVNPA